MSKITADNMAAQLLELQARIMQLEAEKAAATARASGTAGWHVRAIKPPTAEKLAKGSKPGRFSAERILPGGLTVTYYVGGNGKLTIGGTFGTRGVTVWKGDRAALKAYRADMGPDGESADLDRVESTGTWSNGIG